MESDEKVYLQAARQYNLYIQQGQLNQFVWYSFNSEHPPLYKIIYGFALLSEPPLEKYEKSDFVFGVPLAEVQGKQWVLAGRAVSVVCGGLTTLALAAINPLAGLFFATDTFAVKYDSSMFLEALPMLANLLAAICYLGWYRSLRRDADREHWLWLGLSGGFLGVSVACKYIYAVLGIAIVIHLAGSVILKQVPAKALWKLAAWGMLSVVVFFACDPYLWVHTLSRLQDTILFHEAHSQSDAVTSSNLPFWQPFVWFSAPFPKFLDYTSSAFLVEPDSLIGLLALIGLPRLVRRQPFYFIWLATGLVSMLLWPTKWPQYTMIAIIPVCLSAAMGTGWLFDLLKGGLAAWQKGAAKSTLPG